MTDTYSHLDDILKDEIRRSFETCGSQAEYDETYTQLLAFAKEQYDNAWKLLKDQIKDHFREYDLTFSDRRIIVYSYRIEYTICDNGEWSMTEVDASECTSADDISELASRAQSIEDDIENDDILDKVRRYFELCPRRS